MKVPRIAQAMTNIDDDLITAAIEYKRVPLSTRLFHGPILKACACIVVVVCILGTTIWMNKDASKITSPFVLTAYAYSTENHQVSTETLQKGQKIPVSIFESTDGLKGFLISYNKKSEETSFSIVIISNEDNPDHIEGITGIDLDPNQNYYFFVPGDNETEPYSFPMFLTDRENNLACYYELVISKDNGNYYAEITEENISERVSE